MLGAFSCTRRGFLACFPTGTLPWGTNDESLGYKAFPTLIKQPIYFFLKIEIRACLIQYIHTHKNNINVIK